MRENGEEEGALERWMQAQPEAATIRILSRMPGGD
jgi:hypothetical protein